MAKKGNRNNKGSQSFTNEFKNKKNNNIKNKKKKHPDTDGYMDFAEELNPDDFE